MINSSTSRFFLCTSDKINITVRHVKRYFAATLTETPSDNSARLRGSLMLKIMVSAFGCQPIFVNLIVVNLIDVNLIVDNRLL